MTTQTIIAKSYAGLTLTASIHNRLTDADLAPAHTIEVDEITVGGGMYAVVITGASVVAAVTGRLKLFADGDLVDNDQLFTLAGTNGETVDTGAAVLDSAAFTEIKGAGWDSSTDTLEKIRDAISLVSSISVVIPSPVEEIIGMPETLEIGDSYDGDTSIKLYVRDGNDDPVTSFAGHDFTDEDFAPTFTIAPTPGSARGRVVGTVTWIPASGPDEGYLKVEIPSLQSRRAVEGESSVQCVLKWDGYEKSILTTTVRWLPRI